MSVHTPYRVGILGATGAVGQTFVQLLANHPWFKVTALAASKRSAGRPYREAVNWVGASSIPKAIAGLEVEETKPELDCDFVFSGLSSSVAGTVERAFAEAGYPVISNAKNYRMHENVPLLIPEVNPDHAARIEAQDWGSDGYIVTNPNCSTVGLVCALRPLVDAFGVSTVQVTTLQAVSGAGYPGVASLDILGNVVPYIGGEEEKMATEPRKLLGTLTDESITPADITISAQCNRVPVRDGHLECVSVKFDQPVSPDEVREALRDFRSPLETLELPSAPDKFLHVFDEDDRPQPQRNVRLGEGMTVSVGRIRSCEVLDVKFVTLVHNTVRGAAGGAVLNAELLAHQGYISRRTVSKVASA